ncbi:hypothetical protein ACIBCA_09145 [Kitasatospora sp. NPDC051170]|uniref:hypothetical protein n=1 Tax=Kitasatospora sp. NPDC051170 TaxID=3364056 RepID=UPI0037BA30DD
MYEQPGMPPSDPRRHTTPVPPAPPAPPTAPGYAPGFTPAPGYYAPPPPPPRPSRTWLWVTLGVAGGALVVGTGAFALSGSDGDGGSRTANAAPVAGSSGGGAAPAAGGAGGNAGAGKPLMRLRLPSAFQGLTRKDDYPGVADLQKIAQDDSPGSEVRFTAYVGGQFGELYMSALTASQDHPFTEAERGQQLADAFRVNPLSDVKTVRGPVQTLDPGPAGGNLQCATSISTRSQPDALGNRVYSDVQCVLLGVNTEIRIGESEALSGMNISKVADDLRKFRAAAEVSR